MQDVRLYLCLKYTLFKIENVVNKLIQISRVFTKIRIKRYIEFFSIDILLSMIPLINESM